VAQTLEWALANDTLVVTLCHGPAALRSVSQGEMESPFK
jgi:D-lactate dehydratase / protein deglycase